MVRCGVTAPPIEGPGEVVSGTVSRFTLDLLIYEINFGLGIAVGGHTHACNGAYIGGVGDIEGLVTPCVACPL